MNLKVNTISICQIVHRAFKMFPYIWLPVPSPILNREMEQKCFWLILPVITYCRGGARLGDSWVPHGCQGCRGEQRRNK